MYHIRKIASSQYSIQITANSSWAEMFQVNDPWRGDIDLLIQSPSVLRPVPVRDYDEILLVVGVLTCLLIEGMSSVASYYIYTHI